MAILTYKCRNCGSALSFQARTQDWTCDFCGSVFVKGDLLEAESKAAGEAGQAGREEADSYAGEMIAGPGGPEDREFSAGIKNYSCPGCGAEIITDATTAATFCFYCHNPAILPRQLEGVNRPDRVIPFIYAKKVVEDRFLAWCKTKPLLPDNFTSSSQRDKITGIYIPYWLFDCDIDGKINATAKNVRTWTAGNTHYTETKTYAVYRQIRAAFTRVPADGSTKADDKLMETIEPFDYGQIRAFAMPYLSGYQAEKYDLDSQGAFPRVEKRVRDHAVSLLRNTIKGYGVVSISGMDIAFREVRVEYALLPIWMMTYHYKGNSYYFVMNGQTGKVAGKLPLCRTKALKYFFGISAALYVLLVIGGMI
jgi:DNA-directed RNA polymerase subunit RPC12/RpoP